MEEQPLDEQVRRARKGVAKLAKKLRISPQETLTLLMQRELMIINDQLRMIHEMLDLLYGKKKVKGVS